ncbi:Asp23/Gls24 family envelope stress response protein [Phytohabitans suffuscus]|uniref:Alkaline shock response membrane anchor protein AmaP n=1 Tax=Phytohabitans suffuscus TaxID=624315 RepID=A0A6F8YAG2_9ACTN|nr:hypothetical protein [Phytohabitans suffuscus]BCB82941.1 hypothetical protein Psuf_002540 [Phytohabitans suffuscus]
MTNTANRTLWTVVGALLTAAGVAGILLHYNRFFGLTTPSAVLWPALLNRWRGLDPWGPLVAAGAGLVVALLGLWLVRAQLRTSGRRPLPDLHSEAAGDDPATAVGGHTTVRADALTRALRHDLAGQHGIHAAKVAIRGSAARPQLAVRLDLPPQTHLTQLRETVDAAISRFTATSGLRPTQTEITNRITDTPPRVR